MLVAPNTVNLGEIGSRAGKVEYCECRQRQIDKGIASPSRYSPLC